MVISWVYGIDRALGNLREMGIRLHKSVRGYWWVVWVVLTPIASLVSITLINIIILEVPVFTALPRDHSHPPATLDVFPLPGCQINTNPIMCEHTVEYWQQWWWVVIN